MRTYDQSDEPPKTDRSQWLADPALSCFEHKKSGVVFELNTEHRRLSRLILLRESVLLSVRVGFFFHLLRFSTKEVLV